MGFNGGMPFNQLDPCIVKRRCRSLPWFGSAPIGRIADPKRYLAGYIL
jgi:hypothetical protein